MLERSISFKLFVKEIRQGSSFIDQVLVRKETVLFVDMDPRLVNPISPDGKVSVRA